MTLCSPAEGGAGQQRHLSHLAPQGPQQHCMRCTPRHGIATAYMHTASCNWQAGMCVDLTVIAGRGEVVVIGVHAQRAGQGRDVVLAPLQAGRGRRCSCAWCPMLDAWCS